MATTAPATVFDGSSLGHLAFEAHATAGPVVVSLVLQEGPEEMTFAERDDVISALATDGSGDSFDLRILRRVGLVGAISLMGLQLPLVGTIITVGMRSRERFGRLVAIGVGTYLGTQTLLHIAVCTWVVPATRLPMPLVSYGGSSTLVAVSAIALVINVGARREPVLAADGFG